MLFPTTLVGSYPQPEWLIDRMLAFRAEGRRSQLVAEGLGRSEDKAFYSTFRSFQALRHLLVR
jgi:methionine synthase II (cobalamin-independent)